MHNLGFSFLLGITAVPGEIENNAYAKFGGGGGGKGGDFGEWGKGERMEMAFFFFPGITAAPGEIKKKVFEKFGGGGGQMRCIMGDVQVANACN